MSGKLSIECLDFRPLQKGTLVGFATIRIAQMRLTIKDIAIHDKEGRQWAQLPAKPQIDREHRGIVKDGKLQYTTILQFDTKDVADAFSAAVLNAVKTRVPVPA